MSQRTRREEPASTYQHIRRIETRRHRRQIFLAVIVVALIAGVGAVVAVYWGAGGQLSIGKLAPDFTLKEVASTGYTGNTITLSSKQGSVVVLEFMVSWCPHCQANAPIVESIYQNYASTGVFVLAVAETWTSSTGATADLASTQNFIQQYGSQYKYVLDEVGSVARSYGIDSTPTYFILNGLGKISAILIGEQTYAALSNAIQVALSG